MAGKISEDSAATTLVGVQYAGIQSGRNVRVPQALFDAEFMTSAEVAASYQPLDSDLTSIAALTTTSFGRGLLTEASATTARATLGVAEVFDTIALAEAYAPATAPDTIQTRGGAAAGDGDGGLYVNNGTATGDLVITLSDGTTLAGYDRSPDVSLDRLNTNVRAQVETPAFRNLYRKRIAYRIPFSFPDFDDVLALGYASLYPAAWTMDETAEQLWILYASGGGDGKNWIVVWDTSGETLAHVRTFAAGAANSEGIVLRYEDADRFMYVRSSGTDMGKYDVTTLPTALGTITPATTYAIGMASRFGYYDGEWLISLSGSPIGTHARYYVAGRFDDDFNLLGFVNFGQMETGFGTLNDSAYAEYFPKHQSITPCAGYYAAGIGGSWRSINPLDGFRHQGIRIYDAAGTRVVDGIMRPDKLIDIANDAGEDFQRIENEGIYSSGDGKLYTLFVTRHISDSGDATADGLVIFEEFSAAADAIDFSAAASTYPTYDQLKNSNGVFPRAFNTPTDPITGATWTTLEQVLAFMEGTELRLFSFYSSLYPLNDIDGTPIPAGVFVRISNVSNYTFMMEWITEGGSAEYIVYGDPGSRTQQKIRRDLLATGLKLATSLSDNTNKLGRITSSHYDIDATDVLGMQIACLSTSNNVLIGGGSGVANAATEVRFYTGATTTTLTGTERVRVDGSGNVMIYSLGDYADDAAASSGGVPVSGLYHNAGALRIRLT